MYSQIHNNNSSDRLSVADILSSMANGADEPNGTLLGIEGMTCGIPTRTTPTLTPTTLKNIEESFMELQSIPPAPLEHQHQAGFVPPVVSFSGLPLKQEDSHWIDDCMQSSDRSLESPGPTNNIPRSSGKTGRSGGRRPNRDEKLSPEEEERRRVRRERNKLAAARCRKRRMDHTNSLLQETDGLEEKRQNLQSEIHSLNCQKEELEFILEAHKVTCKLGGQQHSQSKNRGASEKPFLNKVKIFSRPNSLALNTSFSSPGVLSTLKTSTDLMDSTLNTPSSGMYNFESLMEGSDNAQSGMPLVISAVSSCSSQQRSSSSDLSSPDSVAPPKLVSL